jgi:hypothetical protein
MPVDRVDPSRYNIHLEDRFGALRLVERHRGYTVPKGVLHRTRAPERAEVLMIEQKGVVPTGD